MTPDPYHTTSSIHRHPLLVALALLAIACALGACRTTRATSGGVEPCPQPAAVSAQARAVAQDTAREIEETSTRLTEGAASATYEETRSREVSFTSRGVELRGVVTTPVADRPGARFPAVVLVHDFGPVSRDGMSKGSMGVELPAEVAVYATLSEELVRRGVAVFRYDKRTCVELSRPRCTYPRAYMDDERDALAEALLDDAGAAVDAARAHPLVDPRRVAILGHGHGATLAMNLRARGGPEKVILFAPSVGGLDRMILHQTEASIVLTRGRIEEEGDTAKRDLLEAQVDALEADLKEQRAVFTALRDGSMKGSDVAFGLPASTWRGYFEQEERAREEFGKKRAGGGELVLYGSLDLTIHPDESQEMEALLGARSAQRRVEILEGVTHDMVLIEDRGTDPAGFDDRIAEMIARFMR